MPNMETKTQIFALLSKQGTACSETAVCLGCLAHGVARRIERNLRSYNNSADPDSPQIAGGWKDCSGNEALQCVHCGKRA